MTDAIDTYAAGTKQLIEDATRLGISWTLRPGTVLITDPLKVTFDGDDTPVSAVSIIGILAVGTRVMGLIVPPGGNFVIGMNDGSQFTSRLQSPVNYSAAGAVGSTTSATYVNMPNLPFVTVIKRFGANDTNIQFIMTTSIFGSGTNTGVQFAVNLTGGTGTDVDLITRLMTASLTHTDFAMTKLLTGLPSGTYTLSGRWRRTASANTLQMDTGDWTTILAEEVWAR